MRWLWLVLAVMAVPASGCPRKEPLPATAMPEGDPELRAAYLIAVALERSRRGDEKGARDAVRAAFAELPALGSLEHPIPVRRPGDEYRLLASISCAEEKRWKKLYGEGFWDVHRNEVTYVEGTRPIDVLYMRCSRAPEMERVLHFEFLSEFDEPDLD